MDDIKIMRPDSRGLIRVELEVHLWSGRKRLRKEALIETNPAFADLPPESLTTLGAIKICDPEDLKDFLRLKREGEKALARSGLPFLGGWGIPDAKIQSLHTKLRELQAEFGEHRERLQRDFAVRIEEWRDKPENEEWKHLIAEVPSAEYVAGRLSFGFHLVRVSAPSDEDGSVLNATYDNQMGGLKGELFADAAREAQLLINKYLIGKDASGVVSKRPKITQKTLRPLRRIAEKLQSFAFLDQSVQPLASVVEHCLKLLPQDGPIDGPHLVHIWSLARTLSSASVAEEAAMLAMHMGSPVDAFEELLTRTGVTAVDSEGETVLQTQDVGSVFEGDQPTSPSEPLPTAAAGEFSDLASLF